MEFKGTVAQNSTYNLTPKRDHPGDQCGPPTEKPPDTSGCGSSRVDGIFVPFIAMRHDGADRVAPFDAISDDEFLFGGKCPSDDALSNIAVDAPSKESLDEFRHRDKVRLHGHNTDSDPTWASGPGFEHLDSSQTATIHWGLTFKRVHR